MPLQVSFDVQFAAFDGTPNEDSGSVLEIASLGAVETVLFSRNVSEVGNFNFSGWIHVNVLLPPTPSYSLVFRVRAGNIFKSIHSYSKLLVDNVLLCLQQPHGDIELQ